MMLHVYDSIPTYTNIEKVYVYASEPRKFLHFYILKLLFPSIFCWYFRYFVSETFIFRSQITSTYIGLYTQSMQFPLFTYGMMLYQQQYTDKTLRLRKCMYTMRASDLRNFLHFYILKLLFPSIFCWYFRYFVSETYLFSGVI